MERGGEEGKVEAREGEGEKRGREDKRMTGHRNLIVAQCDSWNFDWQCDQIPGRTTEREGLFILPHSLRGIS